MVRIITTGCPHDCGGRCVLRVHVENGKPVKVTTVRDPDLKACIRGLNYLSRFNSPYRLKYPMRRVGNKGEGKFERISWDEALDTVAAKMKQIKRDFGNSAFLLCNFGGDTSHLGTYSGIAERLFRLFGGHVSFWSIQSFEGLAFASRYTLGANEGFWGFPADANERNDLLNSRLIIMWGFNPGGNSQGTGTFHHITEARKAGCEMLCIDPILTDTVKLLKVPWIPIMPGTDAAMLAAMAYVMIKENLQDQAYLDKYTVGFDIFKNYILGTEDGVPKTPQWAEKITGVPASTIEDTARLYATTKPAALIQGFAPGRRVYGEQFHRMAFALEAMTGNIGVHGGSAGNCNAYLLRVGGFGKYVPENPVKISIKTDKWADYILKGRAGGYPSDPKMMYVLGAEPVNQLPNCGKGAQALKKLEFLVVHEQFMTPTARFADILLPVTMHWERENIFHPWVGKGTYAIFSHKVVEPAYECRSDLGIFTDLAQRLGIQGYNTRTVEEWHRSFVETENPDIPSYEEFKKRGYYKVELKEPWVAFKKQIDDPEHNPFPTPSGKIEIYSETLAKMDFAKSKFGSYVPPLPQYIPEKVDGAVAKKYPLRLITPHFKYRGHSSFNMADSLTRLYTHEALINTKDAAARGIKSGDTVKISSEVGTISIKAKVTDEIVPGVVAVYEGRYYSPDENGVDRGGCANTLCQDEPSPSGAFAYNGAPIQVDK